MLEDLRTEKYGNGFLDDATAKVLIEKLRAEPGNDKCYDCLTCSGIHRSMGSHLSFVRAPPLDKFKAHQMKRMHLGGNRRLEAYMLENGQERTLRVANVFATRYKELLDERCSDDMAPLQPVPVLSRVNSQGSSMPQSRDMGNLTEESTDKVVDKYFKPELIEQKNTKVKKSTLTQVYSGDDDAFDFESEDCQIAPKPTPSIPPRHSASNKNKSYPVDPPQHGRGPSALRNTGGISGGSNPNNITSMSSDGLDRNKNAGDTAKYPARPDRYSGVNSNVTNEPPKRQPYIPPGKSGPAAISSADYYGNAQQQHSNSTHHQSSIGSGISGSSMINLDDNMEAGKEWIQETANAAMNGVEELASFAISWASSMRNRI